MRHGHGSRQGDFTAIKRSVVFNIDGESYRMRAHRARADNLRKAVDAKTNT